MNDFIADLEAELVSAAHRRATRRRLPRPRLVPVIAFAAVALAALFVVAALDRAQPTDDRPTPPAGNGVLVTVPAALDAMQTEPCEHLKGWTAYAPLDPPLSVFSRARAPADALPGGGDWLPATVVDEDGARRVGWDDDLRLVPVVGPGCPSARTALENGVCLVVGSSLARCFSYTDVVTGKALAITGPGKVVGIVEDGVNSVRVNGVLAQGADNAYEVVVPGIGPGDQVRVEIRGKRRSCSPSPEAYAAVPALDRPPTGDPSAQLERAMAGNGSHGTWRAYAREVKTREGVKVWVVADVPCDAAAGAPERVCLLPEGGALSCDTPAAIARGGLVVRFKRGNREVVAGIAPQGTKRVEVQVFDLIQPIAMTGRVYGTSVRVLPGRHATVRLR